MREAPAEMASELKLARSSGTACSSAAQLKIRPALISDNVKLIRMSAEITAVKMLPNQEGKQTEGVLKHLGLPRALQLIEATAAAREKLQGFTIRFGHCDAFIATAWPSLQTQ